MKTLIIAHNPLSTNNNMGKTLFSLFECAKTEDLCQLYIYPSLPNVSKCTAYYQITDKDVLRFFYKFRVVGREIEADCNSRTLFQSAEDEKLYRSRKNKTPFRKIARDLMWKLAPWYTNGLREWLEREQPDRIFVAPGSAVFLYDMVLTIARDRKIPVVTYICDDYYFVEKSKSVLDGMHQKWLHSKIEKLMERSSHTVAICDEIKHPYETKFRVPATTIMTGAGMEIAAEPRLDMKPTSISYFGNIRCNRYVSLAEIGRTLDEINTEYRRNYTLKIYSAEKDAGILSEFTDIKSVQLCGFITGTEFEKTFRSSEILLHTEAFDEASIDFVKHSVSTKIADSLASGIPLFAYGPEQADRYLTNLHGDWRKIPPEEKRVSHHDFAYVSLEEPFRAR